MLYCSDERGKEYDYHTNRTYELYHNAEQMLCTESILTVQHFIFNVRSFCDVADEYAGEECENRHHDVVCDEIKAVEELHTKQSNF